MKIIKKINLFNRLKRIRRNNLLLILLFVIIITFFNLKDTFYQQDEWLALGEVFSQKIYYLINDFTFTQLIFGQARPIARFLSILVFGNFPFNPYIMTAYNLLFHILNTFIVFFIALKLFKKNMLAFLTAIFFATGSVSSQAIIWFGASLALLPASTLVFASTLFLMVFLENKKSRFLFLSLILAITSLYIKEVGLFLFIFIPSISLIYFKASIKKYINIFLPFLIYVIIFVLYRIIQLISISHTGSFLNQSSFITEARGGIFLNALSNFIIYSLTNLSLIFIPPYFFGIFEKKFIGEFYYFMVRYINFINPSQLLDIFAIILSFFLFIFIILVFKYEKRYKFAITFSLLFLILSLSPYILVNKGYVYLESRYYYISMLSGGIILSVLINFIYQKIFSKFFLFMLMIFFLCLYFSLNVFNIKKDLETQTRLANERKKFINQLYHIKPKLNSNINVFYIDGDTSYIVENNKSPFQQGVGYTLMVLYYKDGYISKNMLKNGYLWNLGEEGYKFSDGYGFGYFDNLENLKKSVKKYNIQKENITSLFYNAKSMKLLNISDRINRGL